jgi:glycine cleavage system H protein
MNIPKDCRYTNEHEWVRPDGAGFVKIGVTDYAQGALGDIVYVELPEPGRVIEQMETFGSIEAVKTVSDLFSPVSGEVVEVNEMIRADASVVNRSPYGDGWMVRARVSNPAEIEKLMTPDAYEKMVSGLEGGH